MEQNWSPVGWFVRILSVQFIDRSNQPAILYWRNWYKFIWGMGLSWIFNWFKISLQGVGWLHYANIYQYDATLEDSALFKQVKRMWDILRMACICKWSGLENIRGWKSYGFLCVINNPKTGGIGCNFQANAVYLNHNGCGHGLPQFLQNIMRISIIQPFNVRQPR